MARAPYPGADRNGLGASNDSMEEKDREAMHLHAESQRQHACTARMNEIVERNDRTSQSHHAKQQRPLHFLSFFAVPITQSSLRRDPASGSTSTQAS